MIKMKNKPSAIAGIGSELAPAEQPVKAPQNVVAGDAVAATDQKQLKPIGTNFRMTPVDWDRLKDLSKSERRSMQELLEEGLNAVFEKRGMQPIKGMPRANRK